jgi:Uma2 family endonuclease
MATITSLLTAEEYARLPDPGHPTELIQGQVISMPPPMPRHGELCAQIVYLLRRFLEDHSLGRVLSNDSGVVTERNPDTVRGADIAYYSFQRVLKGPLPDGLLSVAPELVFEVLSPDDRWREIHVKVAEYLHAGVLAVCVVDDSHRSVHVYHASRPSQVLSGSDEFSLPEILPDLRLPIARFFE